MTQRSVRRVLIGCLAVLLLSVGLAAFGQQVGRQRHPNLAQAQVLIERAIKKISDAQAANEYDLAGHAARAKRLLDQAYAELKLAAEASNGR